MGRRSGCRAHPRHGEGSVGKLTAALRWWFDNGEAWQAAKERADADGSEIPEDLYPPDILDGFGDWFDDFWSLSTERPIGFGAGPIPASAIDRHVTGWGYEDVELFQFCIRRMDEVYLMRQNKTEEPTAPGDPRDAWRAATAGRRGR